jgi:predicted LPLAT superfamily acyltransferase
LYMSEQTQLAQSLSTAVDSAQSSTDPEAKVAALLRLLEIEPQLDPWPFEGPRQDLKDWALASLQTQLARSLSAAVDSAQSLSEPDARIAALLRALEIESQLDSWPMDKPRQDFKDWAFASLQNQFAQSLSAAVDSAQSSPDPEARIAALLRLLEIEPQLDPWPFEGPRQDLKGWALAALIDAYGHRIQGDPAENLETAITRGDAALEVLTREAMPVEWAQAQLNRANAYTQRIRGDRADNVENAIAGYNAALEVLTREAMPVEWAKLQMNLAMAYAQRIRGDRADNQETTIADYDAALEVLTRTVTPVEWAASQMSRAVAYAHRIQGDRAENLETAIAGYDAALEVRTREAMPVEWALVQMNRAVAYTMRVRGDRRDNLETAIAGYDAALEVHTREADPVEWATTQMNRALAYADRIGGNHADNLETAIAGYDAALEVFTRAAVPVDWAGTQMNRAVAYANRIRGDRADNFEVAIAGYDAALEVFTRETMPLEWATTQTNRAAAYRERIRGNRADNLETAIAGYDAALEVRTREANPFDWAATQNGVSMTYAKRIRGNHADNLETAIAGYDAALEVHTREADPFEWAKTQMHRALAYADRIRGDRADNLETAIAGYDAALEVFTREAMPVEWAKSQVNRANACRERIKGDRADNLETAIAGFDAASQVITREAMPFEWAAIQGNRANAYTLRIRGDSAENVEAAIAGYDAALEVFTREAMPVEWAKCQVSRANAYGDRNRGNHADNMETAIAGYDAALEVRTREAMPVDWAHTQMNRAGTFVQRVCGERAYNLETALAGYDAALEVFTREAMPVDWAQSQMGRATAYRERIRGERTENLQAATAGYDAALEVFQAESLPNDHLKVSRLLGAVRLVASDWTGAAKALNAARSTADLLIGQGLNPAETARVLEEVSTLGPQAAFAAAKSGDASAALRELEAGRARQLALALRQNTAREGLKLADRDRLDGLRLHAHIAERDLEAAAPGERQAKLDALIALRRELAGIMDKGLAAKATAEPSLEERVAQLTGTATTLAAPIFTEAGALLLVAHSGAAGPQIETVDLADVSLHALNAELRGEDGWLAAYVTNYASGTARRWLDAIEAIGDRLWTLVAGPLVKALDGRGVVPGSSLLLLPQGALGLLPVGLARDPASGERLFERYELSFAPSIAVLHSKGHDEPVPSLGAIVNPTGDLPFTPIEAALVERLFGAEARSTVTGDEATAKAVLDTLRTKSHWLFSCHGAFNWFDPRQSGLRLAGGLTLTLAALLSAPRLSNPRLVALSACETGLYDVKRSPEEFIGLPVGFLQLGAAGVLATLWPVNDASAALLVSRFFRHHIADRMRPAAALKTAQLWLRDLTIQDLRVLAKEALQSSLPDSVTELLTKIRRDLAADIPTRKPFHHPFHWGGFTLHGG